MSSVTVSFGYSAAVWRLTPMRGLSASAPRVTSTPRTLTSPPSGARRPSRISTVVVLPAPLGPEQPEDLAAGDVEVDAGDGLDVAVALGQAADADDRASLDRDGHARDGAIDGRRRPETSASGVRAIRGLSPRSRPDPPPSRSTNRYRARCWSRRTRRPTPAPARRAPGTHPSPPTRPTSLPASSDRIHFCSSTSQ